MSPPYAIIDPYLLDFDQARGFDPPSEATLEALLRTLHSGGFTIPRDTIYWPLFVQGSWSRSPSGCEVTGKLASTLMHSGGWPGR